MLHSKLDHRQYTGNCKLLKVGEPHHSSFQFFNMLFLKPLQMNCQKRPLSVNVCNSSYGQQLVAQCPIGDLNIVRRNGTLDAKMCRRIVA